MDTVFMNSENCKTSDPRRLLLNLSDTINLKKSDKYVVIALNRGTFIYLMNLLGMFYVLMQQEIAKLIV